MSNSEIVQIRITCLIEASKLKQDPNTHRDHEGKSIVDVAKELEEYVLQDLVLAA